MIFQRERGKKKKKKNPDNQKWNVHPGSVNILVMDPSDGAERELQVVLVVPRC